MAGLFRGGCALPGGRSLEVGLWLLLLATPSLAQAQQPIVDLATIRPLFEDYFELRRFDSEPYGQYRMNASDSGPNYYASLDVALSRTIMGEVFTESLSQQQRDEWVGHLHTFALPNGSYSSTHGHHQLHANGMTIGALGPLGGKQLFPADPIYAPFDTPGEAVSYLNSSINWTSQWSQSHKFWGGLHMYSLSSRATPEWRETVFDWLDENVDPNTGWWRVGQQPSSNVQGLGGGAHIWPIYEHFGREFPEPERVIDRILSMQGSNGRFGSNSGYMDLDALYGLKFMRTLAPEYRSTEINQAVEKFGTYLSGSVHGFLASTPNMHNVLARVGGFGLLNQLDPVRFPDSTGAEWTDIFTDQALYQTAAVETFHVDFEPMGDDLPSGYEAVVLADAPVGYWRLGQTGGLAAPSRTGNENLQGLYIGLGAGSGEGNLGQPGPLPADGFYGMSEGNRAAHLNGSTNLVTIPSTSDVDITGALTMEAWIRLDELPESNGGILAKYVGSGNQRGYNLYVHTQNGGVGGLGMALSPDGTFTSASDMVDDAPLPIGEWVHVAGTFAPNDFMRLYVNGELVQEFTEAADDVPASIYANTADLWIGAQYSTAGEFFFPGLVDEVALYDRALTSEEIHTHYLAASLLPGDFNDDGVVDAADFTLWRNALGSQVDPLSGADANGNGVVDSGDYLVWKQFFGTTSHPATLHPTAAVPEPASAALVLGVVLLAGIAKRRGGLFGC